MSHNCPGSKPMAATDLLSRVTAKDCVLKCNEFSSEYLCYILLCCKLHIHDIYYYTCLHFQASNLQLAATGCHFIAHLAWLWCRTVTFCNVKSVVNTGTGLLYEVTNEFCDRFPKMDLCFRLFLALKRGWDEKIEMPLQFTLFFPSRIAREQHMHPISFRTHYGTSHMQHGCKAFIS